LIPTFSPFSSSEVDDPEDIGEEGFADATPVTTV
jgi:hypothetical protein